MTTRPRNTTLTVGQAYDRSMALANTRSARRDAHMAAFEAAERERQRAIEERLPEEHRPVLRSMLDPPPYHVHFAAPESSPSAPAIPEREPTLERMTELSPERLAVAGKR